MEETNGLPEKIIFASTISVYGDQYNKNIFYEDSLKHPLSPYAVTKLEAEQYLIKNFKNSLWVLRFAPVYSKKFPFKHKSKNKNSWLFFKVGDGTKKLSLCNMNNIGLAVKNILYNNVPIGIYNLSDKNEYTYNDLLNYMKADFIFRIPFSFVKIIFHLGEKIGNNFLRENSLKLIQTNIFPSEKIRKNIRLDFCLDSDE